MGHTMVTKFFLFQISLKIIDRNQKPMLSGLRKSEFQNFSSNDIILVSVRSQLFRHIFEIYLTRTYIYTYTKDFLKLQNLADWIKL